ncbi:MAG: phenylalanine--tRNA ligase subunit beta [Deltaproteobacteria bacterium]|nr:phenylalanine--tRNA ligase subunit beta [Deltaproteobacteria bacterium]
MRASLKWLRELSGVEASADEVAERLTSIGLEVESIERRGEGLDGVVVAEVLEVSGHPKSKKLSLVRVNDGQEQVEVVCGAPNVPAPGGRVIFARVGSRLPNGLTIGEREVAGVLSRGMICSEAELDLGHDSDGIFVFGEHDSDAAPGTPIADALELRDAIFELGLTPNRPDCLGHIGLARDLAAVYGAPFDVTAPCALGERTRPVDFAPESWFAEDMPLVELEIVAKWKQSTSMEPLLRVRVPRIDVSIEDAARCARYGAALVLGVTSGPSPFWLRYRLHCLGVRSISNLVDATNLVLLEEGHPIHGFDLAHVRGSRIVVRTAHEGERMTTLDGVERELIPEDLLICDGEGPVALAGVMGGADSELRDDTQDVLIECAYFDPRSVRRSSRRLGLHTDASHRFERGVDPNAIPRVLARAASWMALLGGGVPVVEAIDVVARPIEPVEIRLRHARLAQLLGAPVDAAESRAILERLGCEVVTSDAESLLVKAPTFRPDLGREVDLIEEVARMRGYDKLEPRVPRVRPSRTGTPASILFERRLREAAAAAGLFEAITMSFVSPRALAAAKASTDAVPLKNPLSEERGVLRTSLLPGLAEAAGVSARRGASSVALFELGTTFHPTAPSEPLPEERHALAFLLWGAPERWVGDDRAHDFYDAKGVAESILAGLGGARLEARLDDALDDEAPHLHPRRRARLSVGGQPVGSLGELHPEVVDALELEGRPVYCELSVSALEAALVAAGLPQASALPRFPATSRDVAMLVDEAQLAGDIEAALAEADDLVESVSLFDLYRGEHVPEGKKSLAFRVRYRDPATTLTDARVDSSHAALRALACSRFGAELR